MSGRPRQQAPPQRRGPRVGDRILFRFGVDPEHVCPGVICELRDDGAGLAVFLPPFVRAAAAANVRRADPATPSAYVAGATRGPDVGQYQEG